MPVTSNMRAGFQDMEMTFGAQAMATEGVMYESKEQMYNVRVCRLIFRYSGLTAEY